MSRELNFRVKIGPVFVWWEQQEILQYVEYKLLNRLCSNDQVVVR